MIKHIRDWDTESLEKFKKELDGELVKREKERCEGLYNAFDVIIENNIKYRIPLEKTCLSNIEYVRECCTVRIDIGRQHGKTQYIIERMNPKKDMVICPNYIRAKSFKDRYCDKFKTSRHVLPVFSDARISYILGSYEKLSDSKVWIDEVESDEQLNIIYSCLSRWSNKGITIIHIGK